MKHLQVDAKYNLYVSCSLSGFGIGLCGTTSINVTELLRTECEGCAGSSLENFPAWVMEICKDLSEHHILSYFGGGTLYYT